MLSLIGEQSPNNKQMPETIYDFEPIRTMEKGDMDSEEYIRQLALEFEISPEKAHKLHLAMLSSPYAGTLEIIDELKSNGIITACLSNTNALHWNYLLKTPEYELLKRVDFLLASHECGYAKPEPEIYHEMEKLTDCKGDEILYFDDVPSNVEGAQKIRWRAHLVDPNQETVPQIRKILEKEKVLAIKAQF